MSGINKERLIIGLAAIGIYGAIFASTMRNYPQRWLPGDTRPEELADQAKASAAFVAAQQAAGHPPPLPTTPLPTTPPAATPPLIPEISEKPTLPESPVACTLVFKAMDERRELTEAEKAAVVYWSFGTLLALKDRHPGEPRMNAFIGAKLRGDFPAEYQHFLTDVDCADAWVGWPPEAMGADGLPPPSMPLPTPEGYVFLRKYIMGTREITEAEHAAAMYWYVAATLGLKAKHPGDLRVAKFVRARLRDILAKDRHFMADIVDYKDSWLGWPPPAAVSPEK